MPIENSKSSNEWKITYIDCVDHHGTGGTMIRFEVTSPDGKTKSIRPIFSMEFIDDYFRIPGDENITINRNRIIEEKEELLKTWGLVKIEELIDQNLLEDEPKILSKDFDWARKIEAGTLRPSGTGQDKNTYLYVRTRQISMLFNAKRPSELSPSEVKSIIGKEEDQQLDFKTVSYQDTSKTEEDWKLDLLKDVTSLANAQGGYLFIGVEEDGNDKAANFRNIDSARDKCKSIFDICYRYIEDKLTADEIVIEPYTIDKNTEVIIIRILPGQNQPYMINFQDNTLFYKRHGKSNRPMTISEIRDIFKSDEHLRRLEKIEKMLEHIIRK